MRPVAKLMPSFLLCWPMMSEAYLGGMAVGTLPTNVPLHFIAVRQMAVEGQSDQMVSDMEMCMQKKCGIEFLQAEKNATH